jgi:hypothetical protein
MERYLNEFNTVNAISQLTLAELWSRDAGNIKTQSNFDRVALLLVPLRIEAEIDEPPYIFLDSLALAWQRHQIEGNYDYSGSHMAVMMSDARFPIIIDYLSRLEKYTRKYRDLRHPIYLAAFYGNYSFVQWKLKRNPSAIPLFTPLRLLYCILKSPEYTKPQDLCGLIDCLHTLGIRPETASNLTPIWSYAVIDDENAEATLWQHILLRCYNAYEFPEIGTLHRLSYVVEKFLEYGADPYFYMSVKNSPNWHLKLVFRVGGERQEQWLRYVIGKRAPCEYEDMSLIELVQRWGFKNKVRILELIEKNLLMLKGIDEVEGTPSPTEDPFTTDPSATLGAIDSSAGNDFNGSPMKRVIDETEIPVDSGLKRGSLAGVTAVGIKKLLSIRNGVSISVLVLGECRVSTPAFFWYLELTLLRYCGCSTDLSVAPLIDCLLQTSHW